MEAYGSQSELISQGVNPAHLLGLMKEKEERDEFVLKGDDDEDEEDEEKDRNGGHVNVYEVCTNWYLFVYSCFAYFRPKSCVSPTLEIMIHGHQTHA